MKTDDRERVLRRQLAEIESALMTSFGPETIMLLGLQTNLRDQLGMPVEESDDEPDYPAAAA